MLAHHIEECLVELARLAVPVRLLRGAHDHIATQRWTDQSARLADAPAPLVISRWGHAVQYGAPDTVAAALLTFAHELAGRAAPERERALRDGPSEVATPTHVGSATAARMALK
jgi:hypothetical protein